MWMEKGLAHRLGTETEHELEIAQVFGLQRKTVVW